MSDSSDRFGFLGGKVVYDPVTGYRLFRFDRKGNAVHGNVVWMRTNPVDGQLPPPHRGNLCCHCKGPLTCQVPTDGGRIVRCDPCDVWMAYEGAV